MTRHLESMVAAAAAQRLSAHGVCFSRRWSPTSAWGSSASTFAVTDWEWREYATHP